MSSKLVKNSSTGGGGSYKYRYASLADMAQQGIDIPKMRIETVTNEQTGAMIEYVQFFDGKEWQRGARVVMSKGVSSNPAQQYGAALTYARRYTTAMAQSIATTDDDLIEQPMTQQETERVNTYRKKVDNLAQAGKYREARAYATQDLTSHHYSKAENDAKVASLNSILGEEG